MSKTELKSVGGVGNTPLTRTIRYNSEINNIPSIDLDYDDHFHKLITLHNGKRMLIDWVTATFDKIQYKYKSGHVEVAESSYKYLDELLLVLTADKKWYQYSEEYARNNYKSALIIGEFIRIQLSGPANANGNRTTMVDLSGSACREFEERGGSWLNLFELLTKWDAKYTRCDPALDDFTENEITLNEVKDAVEKYNYSSCFRKHNIQLGGDNHLETSTGMTIYLGSNKGTGNQLCIYDKKLEQQSKGEEVYHKTWIRYEMRLKQDKATTFVNKYLIKVLKDGYEDFGNLIKSMLFGMLDIKIRSNDSLKRRWKTNPIWINFLDSVEKLILTSEPKKQTIEKKRDWLVRSVSKALAQLYLVDGSEFFIKQLEMIAKKMKEFKDSDIETVNKFLRENKLDELSKKDLLDISKSLYVDNDVDNDNEFNEDDLPF